MPSFVCRTCQSAFEVPQASLDRYPGWVPKVCRKCRNREAGTLAGAGKPSSRAATVKRPGRSALSSATREEDLTVEEVLQRYEGGPQDGVFTDGASHPNPGPGGWGAVYVRDGVLQQEAFGHDPVTTNNRMELTALIRGFDLVPEGVSCDVWTDSLLCVKTINEWARAWQRNGWRRKGGAIKNLDLVQELFAKAQQRPELKVKWIQAHSGHRWNEYADALSTAYRRTHK